MPHTKVVFDALENNAEWFKKRAGEPKSLLYVGWRHDARPWWYDVFCKKLGVEKVGVLEIFPKNIDDLEQEVWAGRYEVKPILGDVRNINAYVNKDEYDVIFWDHGPEHVSWEDLQKTTPLLYDWAGRLVLYCCPWGEWPQGIEDNNEHEIHRNYVTKEQFLELGLSTITFGTPGNSDPGGELVGFKFLKEHSFDNFMGW